jgi:hypothetical protein
MDNLDELERQRSENRERQRRRLEHRSQEERDIENERRILLILVRKHGPFHWFYIILASYHKR